MNNTLRWCSDIGMWSLDRPINDIPNTNITGSCVNRTSFCDVTCYNLKLYRMFPAMLTKDIRNEEFWQSLPTTRRHTYGNPSLESLRKKFKNSRRQTKRVRLMTRGEGIKDKSDVQRVRILCEEFPDIIWWLPTRAWRNAELRDLVQRYLMPLPNLALNASLDPTNTENEIRLLTADGWSTMFYGDDTREYSPTMRGMERMFKCPKTHKKLKNHCGICKGGCFGLTSIGRRTDVHLSQH
jgi:hypothetical protein